jgi:hypothetical protein
MRFAAHVDAMKMVFEGKAHPTASAYINSGRASVTPAILNNYLTELSGNMPFQAWIQYVQAHGRLHLCSANNAPRHIQNLAGQLLEYGVAAYFAAGRIFVDSTAPSAVSLSALTNMGILSLNPCTAPPEEFQGDHPLLTLHLEASHPKSPALLDSLFIPEDRVVVYDKYINSHAAHFLERIARILKAGSSLHVRTTTIDNRCLNINQILTRLMNANPLINIDCKEVTIPFRQENHDRYIFLGDRLQIEFSAGMGSFGLPNSAGNYTKNKKSRVLIYSLEKWHPLEIDDVNGGRLIVRQAV